MVDVGNTRGRYAWCVVRNVGVLNAEKCWMGRMRNVENSMLTLLDSENGTVCGVGSIWSARCGNYLMGEMIDERYLTEKMLGVENAQWRLLDVESGHCGKCLWRISPVCKMPCSERRSGVRSAYKRREVFLLCAVWPFGAGMPKEESSDTCD